MKNVKIFKSFFEEPNTEYGWVSKNIESLTTEIKIEGSLFKIEGSNEEEGLFKIADNKIWQTYPDGYKVFDL